MSEKEAINRLKAHIKGAGLGNGTAVINVADVETVLNTLEETKANKYEINNIISDLIDEMKKQDKIINEMAKAFKQDDVRSVDEIIKYFEEKVENEEK